MIIATANAQIVEKRSANLLLGALCDDVCRLAQSTRTISYLICTYRYSNMIHSPKQILIHLAK